MVYAHTLTKKNPERNEREKREIWVHQKIDECYSTIIVDNDERHRLYLSNEQVGQINVLACLCVGCCSVCFACERLRVERVCLSLLFLYSNRVLFLNCHTHLLRRPQERPR
jgi:hypothetical protein